MANDPHGDRDPQVENHWCREWLAMEMHFQYALEIPDLVRNESSDGPDGKRKSSSPNHGD